MNTGFTTSEQSTVWSRFWSWLSPAKTGSVAPSEVPVAPSEVAPSEVPVAAPEVAVAAPEVPAAAPEVPVAPSEEKPVPSTPPSTPLLESGRSLEIPLDTKPLDVAVGVEQANDEQPNKNDKHEEQPSPDASSAKSHQKKKKRH